MSIPTSYIFKSGSCTKGELFGKVIDELKAAGWKDISSNPTTDFIVLNSKSNTGDKNLILNLRATNASNTNPIDTTDFCQMSYRLQTSYIPGESGAAGTFGRPSLAWTNLYIAPTDASLAVATTITYYIYVDASKLILMLTYPNATGYLPVLTYLGEPDSLYTAEPDSRGVLAAVSAGSPNANVLQICDTTDGLGSGINPYALNLYCLFAPNDPNAGDKSFLSSVYYGSATESFRGKLDGIKCVYFSGSNFVTGDKIVVEDETYQVFIVAVLKTSSFPSRGIAIRTA